ncbi:hypothetical protein LTY59_06190 [Limosilactobacillus balticus]|uniref:Uncharacterized protein n=1 Tax=Limosilactobacillus balticus TaxID=2759747 RepID=A0ABS8RCU6_9LACO|nr:hypothetical protein [Limosilactobacillus balticus]MCD7138808.1 hypothetical protein [Limosilactobacillus balticus]
MTKDEVRAKWAVAKRMVQITQDEWDSHNVEARAIKFVKTKLQIAIYYLSQLDEHDSNYTMPFTGNQMKNALKAPITKQNVKDAAEWCRQCRLLRDKACATWNYEEAKTA